MSNSIVVSTALIFNSISEDGICRWQNDILPIGVIFGIVIVNIVIFHGIPVTSLIVCNIIFAHALTKREQTTVSRRADKNSSGTAANVSANQVTTRQHQKQQNRRNYIIMLMCLTLAYLACSAGLVVFFAMILLSDTLAYVMLFQAFAEIWLIIRYSASFIFYCMSGRAYRLAFVSAIKTKRGSKTDKSRVTSQIATDK